jgi:hypothetical protein
MLNLFLAALTTPPILGSISALLLALRSVTLSYSTFSSKKAICDAKCESSGCSLAPCVRSVSTDLWNCANNILKAKRDLHPVRIALATKFFLKKST